MSQATVETIDVLESDRLSSEWMMCCLCGSGCGITRELFFFRQRMGLWACGPPGCRQTLQWNVSWNASWSPMEILVVQRGGQSSNARPFSLCVFLSSLHTAFNHTADTFVQVELNRDDGFDQCSSRDWALVNLLKVHDENPNPWGRKKTNGDVLKNKDHNRIPK